MNQRKHPICFAPWIHSYVGPSGERGLCCRSEEVTGHKESSFDEFWNSSEMRSIRKTFIEGDFPEKYCLQCKNAIHPDDKYFKSFNPDSPTKELIKKCSDKSGRTSFTPTYLDYRLSNICNLACRMCDSLFSSKIESKANRLLPLTPKIKIDSDIQKKYEDEYYKIILRPGAKKLYFATGESLLQKEHWALIDYCISLNLAKDIKLSYNTNLSYPLEIIKKNISKFECFKSVDILVSFDAFGETGEFLRDGKNWNQFVKNLEFITQETVFNSVSLYYVVTLPGLLNLEETLKFLNHMNLPLSVSMIIPEGYAKLLDPKVLTQQEQSELYRNCLELCQKYDSAVIAPLKDMLKISLSRIESQSDFSKESLAEIASSAYNLDLAFNRNFLLTYYLEYAQTRAFATQLKQLIVVDQEKALFIKESFWLNLFNKIKNKDDIIHLFPNVDKIESSETGKYLVIVSNNSLLSRLLTPRADYKKYEALAYIDEKIESKELIEIYKEYLPPFTYLFRNKKFLNRMGPQIDFLLSPLKRFISLHRLYRYRKV